MTQHADHFAHYSLKHRVIAWTSANLFDRVIYRQRHGLIAGLKRRGGLGWLPIDVADTPEQAFWRSQDFTGRTVYDIGAFHGLLTMLFAAHAEKVIAYEPNSKNRARLLDNLRLNSFDAVIVRPFGLSNENGSAEMATSPLIPGGASIEPTAAAGIVSSGGSIEKIEVRSLDHDIATEALPPPDFIKIDVEGYELQVLMGAARTLSQRHPELFIEIHGETLSLKKENVAAVVGCLLEFGYAKISHVESGTMIGADNSDLAAQGHLHCLKG